MENLFSKAKENPKGFFESAIAVQNTAFKADFAATQLERSCNALLTLGFCGGCSNCNHCRLQEAHNKCLEDLKDPEKVQVRYKNWLEKKYGLIKRHRYVCNDGVQVWRDRSLSIDKEVK